MVDEKEIPNYLYKFREFDSKGYYKALLSKNVLFFSSPRHFNDPFDCKVFPKYNFGTDAEILRKFIEMVRNKSPNAPESFIKKQANLEFKKNISSIRNPDQFLSRANKHVENFYGICSLTENKSNLLMWSHYADSHKGFCVEFDAKKLLEICQNYITIKELIILRKIIYSKSYPLINPYDRDYDNSFFDWVITKSNDWEYENEWRLIYFKHPDNKIDFPDSIISSIYFGAKCIDEHIIEIKQLLKNKKIIPKLYKAFLRDDEFGIEFKQIS